MTWWCGSIPAISVQRKWRPCWGDPTKAREKLGWTPTTTLEQLVAEMVETDHEEARKEALLILREGFNVVGAHQRMTLISADPMEKRSSSDRFWWLAGWPGSAIARALQQRVLWILLTPRP